MRMVIIMGLLVLIGFVIVAIGYSAEQAALRAEATEARAASQIFAKTLKTQLVAAIKTDGPVGAISVCQQIAPAISAQYSTHGLHIGRTALKLRNPANAPDAWERSVLEGFVAAMAKGVDPAALERYAFFSNKNGGKTFRYMKAISVGQSCLACHGRNLAPAVQDSIRQNYPEDQATGFALGDLRGAFTVQKKIAASSR
ncbi:MAG: hypothetical protein COA85_10705 [Robiginitomaculum sp.]|nr:MAG: hypothetical protein COA85_10705 [Robiginitomaculum sp.]